LRAVDPDLVLVARVVALVQLVAAAELRSDRVPHELDGLAVRFLSTIHIVAIDEWLQSDP
jgi:hypothetical protein